MHFENDAVRAAKKDGGDPADVTQPGLVEWKAGILENAMKDCDDKHALNEASVGTPNKLVSLVDNLLDLLSEIMP